MPPRGTAASTLIRANSNPSDHASHGHGGCVESQRILSGYRPIRRRHSVQVGDPRNRCSSIARWPAAGVDLGAARLRDIFEMPDGIHLRRSCSNPQRRQTLKRDEHGPRFFLHQEMRRLALCSDEKREPAEPKLENGTKDDLARSAATRRADPLMQ
jgi:hypothetical protein